MQFQKADSDVNSLSQRLKFEFENNEDLQKTNPAELLSKISDIKQEYASVVKQVHDIQESQKEALDEFRGHLNDVCKLLLTLQTNTGTVPTEKPEELVRLEQFLGSDLPWGAESDQAGSDDTSTVDEPSPAKSEQTRSSIDTECQSYCTENDISQSHERTQDEYTEVSVAEFESVSTLVRGRVKLTDVNSTYRVLWDQFRGNKDCKPLTPDDMHKLGLRVSGATGQAKLKVLRALKLLKLSNKGDVIEVS